MAQYRGEVENIESSGTDSMTRRLSACESESFQLNLRRSAISDGSRYSRGSSQTRSSGSSVETTKILSDQDKSGTERSSENLLSSDNCSSASFIQVRMIDSTASANTMSSGHQHLSRV